MIKQFYKVILGLFLVGVTLTACGTSNEEQSSTSSLNASSTKTYDQQDVADYLSSQKNNTIKKEKSDESGTTTYTFAYLRSSEKFYISASDFWKGGEKTYITTKVEITFKWDNFASGDATASFNYLSESSSMLFEEKITSISVGACPKISSWTYTVTSGSGDYEKNLKTNNLSLISLINGALSWANGITTGINSKLTLW